MPTTAISMSPLIMALTPRPMPMRAPAMINGTAPGSRIRVNTCRSVAPNALAISIEPGSTLRTPLRVFTMMMTRAERKMNVTCVRRLVPNRLNSTGTNIRLGVASRIVTYTPRKASTRR